MALIGATGATGATGGAGATGATGINGNTVLNGTVDPTTQGAIGDFYIKTTTTRLFGPKTETGWGTGVSLIGATGPSGPAGATGATGPTGASGIGGVLIQACATAAGVSNNAITVTDTALRTFICDYNGANAGAGEATVTLTIPSAASYTAGTILTFQTTATTTGGGSTPDSLVLISTGSTYNATGRNDVSTAGTGVDLGAVGFLRIIASGTAWYRLD